MELLQELQKMKEETQAGTIRLINLRRELDEQLRREEEEIVTRRAIEEPESAMRPTTVNVAAESICDSNYSKENNSASDNAAWFGPDCFSRWFVKFSEIFA
jgi:hypothetical protein